MSLLRRSLNSRLSVPACATAGVLLTTGLTTGLITGPATGLTAGSSAAAPAPERSTPHSWFERVATYPVHLNAPAGVDPDDETVAEISTVTEDGRTVIYTDAAGKRIGFLDITDPENPVGTGSIDLSAIGNADDQPTSVATVGDHVLVVIDESGGDFVDPRGRVDVVRLSDREVVASLDLGGQPDSIAVSPDGTVAAIAMENQRDEELTPAGAEEGELPQLPAGSVQVLDLGDADPTRWTTTEVPLVEEDGDPLPAGCPTPPTR